MGKKVSLRLVCDTNVVISALVFNSATAKKLRHAWENQLIIPLVSHDLAAELMRVLSYPKFKLTVAEQQSLLEDYLPYAESYLKIKDHSKQFSCSDKNDQMFIDLALSHQADGIVTGDEDILSMKEILPIEIYTLNQLIKSLAL